MSSPKAAAIAAMFTATLGAAHEDKTAVRIRIEAEVPASLGEFARIGILHFLMGNADRFGHSVDKDGTSVVWAEVDRRGEP